MQLTACNRRIMWIYFREIDVRQSSIRTVLLSAAASGALVCGWSSGAHAQDQDAAQQASSSDIIVTAQRRSERLSQVPISVQAASGESLVKAGITDSTAIQHISAAVSFTGSYSVESSSLAIRGVQSMGSEGGLQPSVAVVIDGVPIARQAEFVADLADIDRIEVLSGPQGTLFGKNSTAGVVNILTKNPTYEYGMTTLLEATTDTEMLAKAAVNVPLSDGVAVRVNGYYRYLAPMVENLGGRDALGQRSYGGQAKILFDFNDSTRLVLTGNYNHSYNTFSPNFILLPNSGAFGDFQRAAFGDVFGRGRKVINQDLLSSNSAESYAMLAELNSELSDNVTLTSVTGYRNYKGLSHIDIDGGPVGYRIGHGFSPNPLGYPIEYVEAPKGSPRYTYKYWSQEFRLNIQAGGFDIVTGLFYQNYDETRVNFLPVAIGRIDPMTGGQSPFAIVSINDTFSAVSDDTYAAFGDVTYGVTDTIKLFGGLRYTREKVKPSFTNRIFNAAPLASLDPETGVVTGAAPDVDIGFTTSGKYNNLSGRVGVQWRPTPNLNFYASYNRGYKGPAVNQGRTVVSASESLLRPEIADAFEIGSKSRFMDGRLGLDISLYYQKIKDVQQASLIPGTILSTLLNAGDLKTKGFQVDAFFEPVRGLNLRAAVVYNDAYYSGTDTAGQPIAYICGPTPTPRCVGGIQSLVGQQALGTPRWKVVSSADYESDLNSNLRLYARVAYNWRSSIQYTLMQDPLTREPDAGFLDASIGIGRADDSWRISIFGRNLTNHFYYNNLNTADSFIGLQFGNVSRDFHRYGGVRLQANF